MWNLNSATTIKTSTYALFTAMIIFLFAGCQLALGQQYIVAEKDNTHPEVTTQLARPAFVTAFIAERGSGYNEIAWQAVREDETRRYIVEYSLNGIDFQTAGEVLTDKGLYTYKHHMLDEDMFRDRPVLYRLKLEQLNNRSFYSAAIFLDGDANQPVSIFPTILRTNTINVNTVWPIEKIVVVSSSGQQVFAQDVNGRKDYLAITLPSLSRGTYLMTFYGAGWKSTSQFVVG
jgi:hypothetical protein